jgi:general secretion pathway protein K
MSAQAAHGESRPSSRDGFIVVAALWILLALATLATVAAAYVAQSAIALSVNDEAVQTEALVGASLELAAYRLSSVERRPTRGDFRFRMSHAEVTVEYISEAARIDLNAAPKELIAGLFAVLGAKPDAAAQYADRVVAWRTPPQPNAPDSEDALYRAAGLRYSPRRSPFSHVDELWLVLSLPPALVERALPFVTIYSGLREVNVLDAPAEVIAALPGISSGRLNAFLEQRESMPADPQFIAGALGENQAGATIKGSDAYRVRTRIAFDNGWRKTSEAVIMMQVGSSVEPYLVLSWQDDIDPAAGTRRAAGGRRAGGG